MAAEVLDELIDQQFKRWQFAQQRSTPLIQPSIAISRQPGTPAAKLGQMLAERLDYDFFGTELIDEISRSEHIDRYLVEHFDEHVRNGLDRWLLDTFHSSPWTERQHFNKTSQVVSMLAHKGGAVILGRGSIFMLADEPVLRIFVVESRSTRISRLAEAKRLSLAEAGDQLDKEEQDRGRFLQELDPDPDNPVHFDLVINTDRYSLDYWVEIIACALANLRSE